MIDFTNSNDDIKIGGILSGRIVYLVSSLADLNLEANDVGVVREPGAKDSGVFFLKTRSLVRVGNSDLRDINPKHYGDGQSHKICNVCHRILSTALFDLNQSGKGDRPVRRPSCKDCRKSIDGVPMKSAEKRLWEAQKPKLVDFECPICKKTTIAGLTSKVVLNHDHATGRILGWICDSCNTGLGRFKDDIKILNEAIRYLEEH